MTGYSLKTFYAQNQLHLTDWVIEGRNEGEDWEKLDERSTYDLMGPNRHHFYSLSKISKPFQYFRLRSMMGYQKSLAHYSLILNNIEIYGEISKID